MTDDAWIYWLMIILLAFLSLAALAVMEAPNSRFARCWVGRIVNRGLVWLLASREPR